MTSDLNPANDHTAPTTRRWIGRRLAAGAVLAGGVGGVAYAATTDTPTPSTSTTTPDDGTATAPEDGTTSGPENGELYEQDAGADGSTTSYDAAGRPS